MITDKETNTVYISDILHKLNPVFYSNFVNILNDCKIQHSIIPHTKDIWAVDYMPIQIEINEYIQFKYNPDYLQSKKWIKTISDVDLICNEIEINPKKSNIKLDGGNVIKAIDKVILCDKIFKENPNFTKRQLIIELEELFQVDSIYFVPQQPKDYTGHADGMLRFLNNETVLINNFTNENESFKRAFFIALHNAKLNYIEIPYIPNVNCNHANGYYINYLQMADIIIIPTFGIKEDEIAVKQFEGLFPRQKIITINSNEIACKGGVLNCITWNIKT